MRGTIPVTQRPGVYGGGLATTTQVNPGQSALTGGGMASSMASTGGKPMPANANAGRTGAPAGRSGGKGSQGGLSSGGAGGGAGQFSWNGGATNGFNAEAFGQQIGGDIAAAYGRGPAPIWDGYGYAGLGAGTQAGMGGMLDAAQSAMGFDRNAYLAQNPDVAASGMDPMQHYLIHGRNEGRAGGGTSMFQGGIDYTTGLLGTGGMAGNQRDSVNTVNNVGNAFSGIQQALMNPSAAETGYMDMYRQAGNPSLTEQALMARARGEEVANNPYLSDIIRQTSDSAYADVMASLGSSGRTGSNVHMNELGSTLANNESQLRYADYNNALGRQTEALGMIEAMRQQGFGNRASALGASDSARLNQLGARMGALNSQAGMAGNAFNMEQQGIANAMGASAALPGLYQASLLPSQTMLNVGMMSDADRQARIEADRERFNRLNDPQFQHIAQYLGLLGAQQGAAPQPERQPGPLDWIGTLGSLAVGLL